MSPTQAKTARRGKSSAGQGWEYHRKKVRDLGRRADRDKKVAWQNEFVSVQADAPKAECKDGKHVEGKDIAGDGGRLHHPCIRSGDGSEPGWWDDRVEEYGRNFKK